jgi:hypothetical protein
MENFDTFLEETNKKTILQDLEVVTHNDTKEAEDKYLEYLKDLDVDLSFLEGTDYDYILEKYNKLKET